MIDLTKHVLPSTVSVGGRTYRIKTDHALWIRFSVLIRETGGGPERFDFLYEGEVDGPRLVPGSIPEDRAEGLMELARFFAPREELPAVEDVDADGPRAMDYLVDGTMIYAAFMQCYRIDLVDTPLHWHKFLALLNGLRGTALNDVMGYRLWEKSDEKYEQAMERLRRQWELPPLPEEKRTLDRFNSQFE